MPQRERAVENSSRHVTAFGLLPLKARWILWDTIPENSPPKRGTIMGPCFQEELAQIHNTWLLELGAQSRQSRQPAPKLSQSRKSIVVSRSRAEYGSRNIEAKSSPLQSRPQAPKWWQRTEWWSAGLAPAKPVHCLLQLQLLHCL